MKSARLLIPFFLIIFVSCTRTINGSEDSYLISDLIYTDSFSPSSYESPVSRRVVIAQDKDIGIMVSPETTDPTLKAVYSILEKFFASAAQEKPLASFFTNAAYNSFRLRYPSPVLKGTYSIRIGLPEISLDSPFTVKYKIISKKSSLTGIIELTPDKNSYNISDYDPESFDLIFN